MAREIKDELQGQATPEVAPGRFDQPLPAQPLPEQNLQLQLIGQQQRMATAIVMEDFTAAESARKERTFGKTAKGETLDFDKWRQDLVDLYFGQRIPKTIPWQYCSNRSLMIGQAILEVMHSRLFPAIYNEELTHWRPTKVVDIPKSETVEKLMFWWMRVHVKAREFFDRWVRHTVGFGWTLTETTLEVDYLDKGATTQGSQQVNPDGSVSIVPGERIVERVVKTRSDVIPVEDVFLQKGATSIQRDPVIIRCSYLYRELEQMEKDGKAVNISIKTDPSIPTLKEILPIPAAPEAASPEEAEMVKDVKRRNIPVVCLKYYGAVDFDGDGHAEEVRLLIYPEQRLYLGGVELKDISNRGIRPLDLTMYLPRLNEPSGLFGMGVLEQVKELALEIDAIFNQMTDAHTLAVLRPFAYRPSGDLTMGNVTLAPNKGIPVEDPSRDLFVPDFRIATDQLLNAVNTVMAFIERLTAANAFIFGKQDELAGGSGTATRTNAIVSAATERFTIPAQRLRDGGARIVTQHLDILQKNMPQGLEEQVIGEAGEPVFAPGALSAEGISGEYDCYLLPDESLGSKEAERQLSQQLYALLTGNLLVATDPAKLYKITADVLKAWGKDPQVYLGPAPDISAQIDPADENTLMLSGDFGQVKTNVMQNHLQHIAEHRRLEQSPVFQALGSKPELQLQVAQFNEAHIQEHMQLLQLVIAQMAQAAKGGKGVMFGGSNGRRAPGGTPGATQAIGPEPGVGSVQNPLAGARNIQRAGESLSTP